MTGPFGEIIEAVLAGNAHKVKEEVHQALQKGVDPTQIITEGFVKAMEIVSEKFEHNEIYVTDLIITARAMHTGMQELRPYMVSGQVQTVGRAVIGTVYGDIHDIGKNLLGILLEASGFEVIDMGVNVAPSSFVEAVIKYRPQVLCLSALLSSTRRSMVETIQALEEAGLRQKVKIVVGGTPLNATIAAQMGADGYAPDATSAIPLIKELTGAGRRRPPTLQPALLTRILGEGAVRALQESISELSGLDLVVIDTRGNLLSPLGRFLECSQYCQVQASKDRPATFGQDITTHVGHFKGAFVYRCPAGLVEISYPLANEDGTVGAILCGHCFLEDDQPSRRGVPMSIVPVLSLKDLEAVCGLLSFVAGQIVQLSALMTAKQELEEERNSFIHFLQKQHQLEQALKDAEFKVLQSQVNPHFLFNTLNTISRLALFEGAENTERVVRALARLLRYTLTQVKGLVTVREELAAVEDYLFIQQTRFSDRLISEIEVVPEVLEAQVPCMVLQPLVENAVIHGLEPLKEGGKIFIRGRILGTQVHIEIQDTGVGIPEEKQKEIFDLEVRRSGKGQMSGLGIVNVYRRLQYYFGSDCALNVHSRPGAGTIVQLTFPLWEKSKIKGG
ncbi:MAG: histidine kinase [Moorellaceae bacterium]